MSEKAPSTPDLEYAEQLRVGWVKVDSEDVNKVQQLRTPIDVNQVGTSGGELTDGVRAQLDMVVDSVDSVNQHAHKLPGYTKEHTDALQQGYVLAGENLSGGSGKTEMRFASPEEFRVMVARAVGEKALKAYEDELIGDNTSDITVPRLISTVTNMDSSGGSAAIQEPGELRNTLKPASAVEMPTDDAPAPGKLISTFGNQESRTATEDEAVAAESAPEEPEPTLESEDDGWVSFEESTPLPVREVNSTPQAAEAVAEVEETTDTPEADKNIEVATLKDVMQSPQTMLEAMDSEDTTPELKQQLENIVRSWNTLKAAKVADEVWQEVVLPKLSKLDQSLPGLHNKAKQMAQGLHELEEGLTMLSTAAEYGDLERMGQLARRYNYIESFDQIARNSYSVLSDDTVGNVSRTLDLGMMEGDDRIKRVMRSDLTGFSEQDAQELFNVQGVGEAGTVEEVKEALEKADSTGALKQLRKRRDAIQTMIQYGRNTDRVMSRENLQGSMRAVSNQLQELFAMRSRMTSSDVAMVRAKIRRDLLDQVDQLEKFSRLTQLFRDEIH